MVEGDEEPMALQNTRARRRRNRQREGSGDWMGKNRVNKTMLTARMTQADTRRGR